MLGSTDTIPKYSYEHYFKYDLASLTAGYTAPEIFACSIAWITAFLFCSDPSVANKIFLYNSLMIPLP